MRILRFPIAALVMTCVCGQAPLYYSNQNQYFLHGMALAGVGGLEDDWLAGTLDPTPVFSVFVAGTVRFLHPWAFHVVYALLLAAYAWAALGLFSFIVGDDRAKARRPMFAVLFLFVHAAIVRWASQRLLGQDLPYYFQGGVAGQYILGAMLQPSTFGILLVVATCLFVKGRPFLAGTFVALTATVHFTYLLPGALLTLGFLTALVVEKQFRRAATLAVWTLLLVLPVMIHALLTFRPTSAEAFAEAQHILADIRIPHHTRPELWFDRTAALQVVWIALGIATTWRTRLFPVLAVPYVLSVVLTLTQVLTKSDTFSLLFPWRISAVLMPIATTAILARLAMLPRLDERAVRSVSVAVVVLLASAGIWIVADRQAYRTNDDENRLMEFVRRNRGDGDLYLLPVRIPDLKAATRGSLSSDFKPPAEKKADARLVPLDMQRFRLHAEAPIFVDFKSIPYHDRDVIEWYARLRIVQEIDLDLREGRTTQALSAMRARGITHLISRSGRTLPDDEADVVYTDEHYVVHRLRR